MSHQLELTFAMFSMFSISPFFLHRRQHPQQQHIRSHKEGFIESIPFVSMLSTFRLLNTFPIFRKGRQQQLPHF
jgi:hypothetical protein